MPCAILWSLWKLRNEAVFNGKQWQLEEFCELIKTRIAIWVKAHSKDCWYTM
ncbi:hypothetical protein ACSBR2_014614 [Camellia fascicularis]